MSTERGDRLGPQLLWLVGALLLGALVLRLLGFVEPLPPPPEPTAGKALAQITTAAADLDLRPLWDNLPPPWQAEANRAVDKLHASANPELWAEGFELIARVADLTALPPEQAGGIDASQRFAALLGVPASPSPNAEPIRRARLRLAAGLRTILDSGLANPDNLAYLDLRDLCHDFLPSVEEELQTFAAKGASAGREETTFTVELPSTIQAEPRRVTLQFAQLDGCWVESGFAADFPRYLAAAHRELDLWTATPGSKDAEHALGMLAATHAGLDALEQAAGDPQAFDLALDALTAELLTRVVRRKVGSLFD